MINERKWEVLGELSKSVKRDLEKMSRLSKELKISKGGSGSLTRSITQVDKFRSKAENEMFSYGIKRFDIFYGDPE